jgi:hypothetical protein
MSVQQEYSAGLSEKEADELVRTIWHASRVLAGCGRPNLEPRAREIEALAHFMLYDADGGLEDGR